MIPVGQQFGKWTVGEGEAVGHKWPCRCACGVERFVSRFDLRSGKSVSCGCGQREAAAITGRSAATHGEARHGARTPEYKSWNHMIQRCTNPRYPFYSAYGGRGISVCHEWREYEAFLRDMGRKPGPEYSLERKDNSGPYSPQNVVWATREQQGKNKRNNRLVTFQGRTQPVSAWAQEFELHPGALLYRLNSGWPLELALNVRPDRKKPMIRKGDPK